MPARILTAVVLVTGCSGIINGGDTPPSAADASEDQDAAPGSGADGDGDGVPDGEDNCPFAPNPDQLESEICVWPNAVSGANSDPWIAGAHDRLEEMRPRFLVVNFANGIGVGGNDEIEPGSTLDEAALRGKAQAFLDLMREASRHRPSRDPDARPFLVPEIARIVDLQDDNGHANSDLFPRGQTIPETGYRTVGYYQLFQDAYAPHWGYEEGGRFLRLGELVDRGLVHEVIVIANQVDGREPNPPGEVTSNILEVAFVAQAYDASRAQRPGEFVKNGVAFERQKADMAQATAQDHNSMPWEGRSVRIYFLNASRGAGCLAHSLAHEMEFRYNESRIYSPGASYHGQTPHPYLQSLFRRFAGFDLATRQGAPFDSLYAGGDAYSYSSCDADGVCDTLSYGDGTISPWRPGCGNAHYTPSSRNGYDYEPAAGARSFCETFQQPDEEAAPLTPASWDHVTSDPAIDGDCGGKFLTFWYQNMPGLHTTAVDANGAPMLNWWPFMYY